MMRGHAKCLSYRRGAFGATVRLAALALVSCTVMSSDTENPGETRQPVVGQIVPSSPVGKLPGGMSVGANGAATYALPIDVPNGRAGIEPNLVLTYSSRAENSLTGVGWS